MSSLHGSIATVPAQPEPATAPRTGRSRPASRRTVECSPSAASSQAARTGAMPGPGDLDARVILREAVHLAGHARDAEHVGARGERGVECRAAHPEPGAGAEAVGDRPRAVGVGDAAKRHPVGLHSETLEQGHGAGHEPLAARLVDGAVARLDERDGESGHPRLDRRRESDRAAADHDDVDWAHESCFNARSSTGMRKPISRIALSTVNAMAVTHAVWTSGSAMPSTATST